MPQRSERFTNGQHAMGRAEVLKMKPTLVDQPQQLVREESTLLMPCRSHSLYRQFSWCTSDWKIKVEQMFWLMGAKTVVPRSATVKSRDFSGNFQQVASRSWCTSLKNCNRVCQYEPEDTAQPKAVAAKGWKCSGQSRLIRSKGHGSSFVGMLKAFFFV